MVRSWRAKCLAHRLQIVTWDGDTSACEERMTNVTRTRAHLQYYEHHNKRIGNRRPIRLHDSGCVDQWRAPGSVSPQTPPRQG